MLAAAVACEFMATGYDLLDDVYDHASGATALTRDLPRLTRRYDTLVVTAGLEALLAAPILPLPRVILVVPVGTGYVAQLARDAATLRAEGAQLVGVVLWDRDEPHVPTREELEAIAAAARTGVPAELLIETRVG